MIYLAQKFTSLIGITGLSKKLLDNHFALYEGYVVNTNKLIAELKQMQVEGKTNTPSFAELSRRFGWEFNGMRLHELYFDNLIKNGLKLDPSSLLAKQITADFFSFDDWQKEFNTLATIRGIGWVILYFDRKSNKLINTWVNEHDSGHLSGCEPILVLDLFEHAYMLDFGIKKVEYLPVFINNINWKIAEKRFVKTKI